MPAITILLVDDAAHWRKFVSFVLRIDPALEIISEVSDGTCAIQEARELQPAIVLLDIRLPGICGLEAGRQILKDAPNCKVIFVSQEADIEIVAEAFGVGAAGYVLKIDAGSQLVTAIHHAIRGQRFISSSIPPTARNKH
jgi:DNA-binding NarL/FixJ family response regulator